MKTVHVVKLVGRPRRSEVGFSHYLTLNCLSVNKLRLRLQRIRFRINFWNIISYVKLDHTWIWFLSGSGTMVLWWWGVFFTIATETCLMLITSHCRLGMMYVKSYSLLTKISQLALILILPQSWIEWSWRFWGDCFGFCCVCKPKFEITEVSCYILSS